MSKKLVDTMQSFSEPVLAAHRYRKRPVGKLRVNPRLDANGSEVLDPQSAVAPIGFRPMTEFERLQRMVAHGQSLDRFLPDDDLSDDDFGEHLDDIPPEGYSPYEVIEMDKGVTKKRSKSVSPVPAPTPAAPPPSPAPTPSPAPSQGNGEE